MNGAAAGAQDVQWHETADLTVRNLMFDGTYNRYVYGTKHRDSQAINELVCKYEKTSRYGCGNIIDKEYTPNWIESPTSTYIRVRNSSGLDLSEPGDSGGPWFYNNTAYGIDEWATW